MNILIGDSTLPITLHNVYHLPDSQVRLFSEGLNTGTYSTMTQPDPAFDALRSPDGVVIDIGEVHAKNGVFPMPAKVVNTMATAMPATIVDDGDHADVDIGPED